MPKIKENEGIEFLRCLINSEPRTLPSGLHDPGWCCVEHSVVASMAFCIAGIRAYRCYGKVIVGSLNEKVFNDVMPHSFVLVENPRMGIFDSSITFNSIHGIPIAFSSSIPDFSAGLLNEKPTFQDWEREGKLAGKSQYALYGIKKKNLPDEKYLSWEMDTPFGNWLTKEFGSQKGLWSKAAWFTAQVFTGQPVFAFKGIDKRRIWELVQATAEKDTLVTGKLKSFS